MSEAATLGVASLTTCGAGAAAAADFAAALRVVLPLAAFAALVRAVLVDRAVDFVVLALAMMTLPALFLFRWHHITISGQPVATLDGRNEGGGELPVGRVAVIVAVPAAALLAAAPRSGLPKRCHHR
ncbi:hypothetical protein [Sediminimonas sp.]|uniref:hypothetical protein n=1 Tax=Sediminimonas sp. TaxID=2823379 RepID=UPI0025E5E050|nr:hypothetical protein [Sediminimonas sp.]